MKYAILLMVLAGVGGLIYLYEEQPDVWNSLIVGGTPAPHGVFVPPNPIPAQPHWKWTTRDGKVYQDVVIKKVEADCVTILYRDGGARIDTYNLPDGIQKQLNYDPALAGDVAMKRAADDEISAAELAQEKKAIIEEQKRNATLPPASHP
ncbi:MAG TPA: hypothetical protein VL981_07585 [Candidatus Methylacidiphilales bacterium]|nr:hypothetical protein [Candidatus Methylacidiphilales bacterium]